MQNFIKRAGNAEWIKQVHSALFFQPVLWSLSSGFLNYYILCDFYSFWFFHFTSHKAQSLIRHQSQPSVSFEYCNRWKLSLGGLGGKGFWKPGFDCRKTINKRLSNLNGFKHLSTSKLLLLLSFIVILRWNLFYFCSSEMLQKNRTTTYCWRSCQTTVCNTFRAFCEAFQYINLTSTC